MKYIYIDNIKYKVGRNAKDNWKLLDESKPDEYFFHLSSFSSGYVIVETNDLTDKIIYNASLLCKDFTKYRSINNLKVDYCLCSNLTKTDKIGEVVYKKKRDVKQFKLTI
jgi:predicted ribosome quality control (RQC) complex YloA/Tae2 family protein